MSYQDEMELAEIDVYDQRGANKIAEREEKNLNKIIYGPASDSSQDEDPWLNDMPYDEYEEEMNF